MIFTFTTSVITATNYKKIKIEYAGHARRNLINRYLSEVDDVDGAHQANATVWHASAGWPKNWSW